MLNSVNDVWKCEIEADEVENVPSGILFCEIDGVECGIAAVSVKSVVVRTADKLDNKEHVILLKGYCFKSNSYESHIVEYNNIVCVLQNDFGYMYRITFDSNSTKDIILTVLNSYNRYIIEKNSSIGSEFSKSMTGYPEELDDVYCSSYEEQKNNILGEMPIEKCIDDEKELYISIDNPREYEKYLQLNDREYFSEYFIRNKINNSQLDRYISKISGIYVGNQFCHNLMCDTDMLIKICGKAKENNKKVVLCYTYINENNIVKISEQLEAVYDWCKNNNVYIEIVFNDYGMLEILKKNSKYKKYISLNAGILINKMRKDPRFIYKNGFNSDMPQESCIHDRSFTEELKKYGVCRLEYESCGHAIELNHDVKASINIPFYQTNTSNYCPLRAVVITRERQMQKDCDICQHICLDKCFLYPSHLNVFGIYNSLFSVDTELFKDEAGANKLTDLFKQGADRIVLNFL